MSPSDRSLVGLFDDRELRESRLTDSERQFVESWRIIANSVFPAQHSFAYMSCPITGGKRAMERAEAEGMPNHVVLREKMSEQDYYTDIIAPNIAEAQERDTAYKLRHPDEAVITPTRIEGAMRQASASNVHLSEDAFMAFWYDVMNHQVGKSVEPEGWAFSNGATEEVMEMTCIAAGLRDRPNKDAKTVRYEDDSEIKLDQIAATVGDSYDRLERGGQTGPVQATTLARLFKIHDLIQEGRITPEQTAEGFMDYDMGAMERLKQKYEPKLKQPEIAATMTLDGLDASYREAAARAHGSARPAVASRGPAPAG